MPKALPPPAEPAAEAADPGGVFVNVSAVALTIPFPPTVVPPGGVVRLPYTPTHRDLKPATDTDIAASLAAEDAETTTPGQEP